MAKSNKKSQNTENNSATDKLTLEEAEEEKNKEMLALIDLVNIVRYSKNKIKSDLAFKKILEVLDPKIKQLSYQFIIPGYSKEDNYQEALFALRYKAIKDYDQSRSNLGPISKFDNFAMLCMRRHLSTKYKASCQNKSVTLNKAKSIDQDRSSSSKSEDNLFLSDIIPQKNSDVAKKVQDKEHFNIFMSKLFHRLSEFERQILKLYEHKYSYSEMIDIINRKYGKDSVEVKSVDNALSRIKRKSIESMKKILKDEGCTTEEIKKFFSKKRKK